jgi:hypothetical protein
MAGKDRSIRIGIYRLRVSAAEHPAFRAPDRNVEGVQPGAPRTQQLFESQVRRIASKVDGHWLLYTRAGKSDADIVMTSGD